MERLERAVYESLRAGAQVLEADQYGDKVLRLTDGTFMKLFRRKSWISKSLFNPPAKRFARNALELQVREIQCPTVINLFYIADPYRSVVHYEPLEGTTLRDTLRAEGGAWQAAHIGRLARFLNRIHDSGVYFRSLHLGNIVLTPNGELGLIDISDMNCGSRPLSPALRERNMKHLFRYEAEWPPEAREQLLRSLRQTQG